MSTMRRRRARRVATCCHRSCPVSWYLLPTYLELVPERRLLPFVGSFVGNFVDPIGRKLGISTKLPKVFREGFLGQALPRPRRLRWPPNVSVALVHAAAGPAVAGHSRGPLAHPVNALLRKS